MLDLPVIQPEKPFGTEPEIAEVSFKGNRREYFVTPEPGLKVGEYVVVDMERGQDLGRVRTVGGVAAKKCSSCVDGGTGATPERRIRRRASADEVERLFMLRADEERVRRQARALVEQHHLKMKLTECEWQWDKNKLTLYFTAERRVDFRQLVRDLARTFRTRIELKQIGVRDEAALLGGVGRCGRELCCSTWLREIKPISLQLAKDQNLSLNPAQISGTCGRLMCCLTYEHDAYLQARKRFPREGRTIRTKLGQEKVIGIDIFRDQITLLDESRQRRIVSLTDLRAETAEAQRDGSTEEPRAPTPNEAVTPTAGSTESARRRRRGKRSPGTPEGQEN
jgi:cell fate regulator YaaT (PSP1 superfamily)